MYTVISYIVGQIRPFSTKSEPQDPITLRTFLGLSTIMMMSRNKFDGFEIGQKLRTT